VSRNWSRIFDSLLGGSPWEWIGFLVVLILIGLAIVVVSRYRASLRDDADPAAADALLVRRVRELRDRGEVSEDEYRSLRGRIRRAGGDDVATRNADETPESEGRSSGRRAEEFAADAGEMGRTRPEGSPAWSRPLAGAFTKRGGRVRTARREPGGTVEPPRHAC